MPCIPAWYYLVILSLINAVLYHVYIELHTASAYDICTSISGITYPAGHLLAMSTKGLHAWYNSVNFN